MLDRRQSVRNEVIYAAEIAEDGASKQCVVRSISNDGAHVEFSNHFNPAKDSIRLMIAKKGRSVLAKIVCWRDNFVGVAFGPEGHELPGSDLAMRLRRSEKKKRELQRRINELIGEG